MTRSEADTQAALVRIGVIVPVFRHSGLVVEALWSLENQVEAPPFAVVIVNDGCPFDETDRVCKSFARFGDLVTFHYIRRRNGGLSTARNSGIQYLLRSYPRLEAIYFLDADNRLKSYSLAKMAEAMDGFPEADWFYPDIQMFGLDCVSHYDGAYSGLIHTSTNISEAGSLVRRRVFEAGVRFDESMRQGFEDWDFWLGARERGFKGQHVPHLGFEYRKRPESMLADSMRDETEIKAYMRRKRRSTFQPQHLLALEADEAPRYAIVMDGTNVHCQLDPLSFVDSILSDEFTRRFWCWMLRPDTNFVPPFVVCASSKAFEAAEKAGVLRWIFWDLETRLRNTHCAVTVLDRSATATASTEQAARTELHFGLDAHFVMLSVDLLREICNDPNGFDWWCDVMAGREKTSVSRRSVRLNRFAIEQVSGQTVLQDLFRFVCYLHRSEYAQARKTNWKWAFSGVPARHTAYLTVRAAANNGVVMPWKPDGRRQIALLLPFVDFGGVEKVAFNVAQVLRSNGYIPHLVLFGSGDIHIPAAMRDVFESLSWVTADGLLRWDGDLYYGTKLSWWSQHGDRQDVLGLLSWFDAVINCQCADAHGIMGHLRRCGVITLTHQHVVELSAAGRPGGNAMIARAFEHSYVGILTGSRRLMSWLIANGIPREKLFNVDNAASYEMAPGALDAMARERAERARGRQPLRVLFAARMDVQKGLDRLVELIERSRDLELDWRIVGKAVVTSDPLLDRLALLCSVERPVYTESELTALYRWADVIVLPSRYEGVPLTAIEAMRCGAVMLASKAGAIDEVVQTGIDGIIVSQETCVEDMLVALIRFRSDRGALLAMSQAAMRSGRERSWEHSLAEVLTDLGVRFADRDKTRAPFVLES